MYIKIPDSEYDESKLVSADGYFVVYGIENNGYYYVPAFVLAPPMYSFANEYLSQYPIVEWQPPEVTDEPI